MIYNYICKYINFFKTITLILMEDYHTVKEEKTSEEENFLLLSP